ncbi:O-antigen ligase family protein [Rhodospirillum sp. A1_3_36]|uniref:O-antigen ligase family protein n=1 Tax=Rhodospirillum sp. A1_3_36 TaxID=3391666 RepID=UPI0039A66D3B
MIVGTALLLSHSRGALISTVAAIAVLVFALRIGGVMKTRGTGWIFLLPLIFGIGLVLISGDRTAERFLFVVEEGQDRASLYSQVLTAIGDAPWTGFGLGAFEPAFHLYQNEDLLDSKIFDFAHGVQLEFAMDLGLPFAALFLLAILILLITCARGLRRRRRDQIFPAVALATGVLLGVHGLMDFSAQMPAVAILFAHLLGIGYAQSFNSDRRGRQKDGAIDGHTNEEKQPTDPPTSAILQ